MSMSNDRLSIYVTAFCPFCHRVERVIKELGVDVEVRNIMGMNDHRNELIAARGRQTVPVLRIDSPDGESHWMPESGDIIHYLLENHGPVQAE